MGQLREARCGAAKFIDMDPASTAASIYYNGPTSVYSLQQVVGKPSTIFDLGHIEHSNI